MTATAALTTDLQRQVLALETDLRDRLAADPEREGEWKREHHQAVEKERTAAAWTQWRDDRITQAAVAWVLTTVFIRFCEDNALLKPVWITGGGSRRQEALDAQLEYFRRHPEDTGREWLLDAIGYLSKLPATKALVEPHSALHLIAPSGNAADDLLTFWRQRDEEGNLVHDLADPELSTRFLGDLYQDLSQHAKDTYALLQTPVFVEEFILDRTMEPALKERPLEGFLMIDPACGSGHFLLGAFTRLLDRWHRHAPGLDAQARVQKALDAVNGVDLNPFAIAIARFRLLLAALQAAGLRSLEKAPAFTVNLAAGDSLIHGPDPGVLPGMSDRSAYMPFTYQTEDADLLLTLLEEGRYDVVVGNPPYVTPKDKALNQIYRSKYADVCKGVYALTVPFMKLMFSLAKSGDMVGWIGQITSNSFMKREFGTKLIENFLAHRDLRLVVDTSGAFIPGHGTPTIILVGRNQIPVEAVVRAALGVRSEPSRPDDPAKGMVWRAIIDHIDSPGWNDGWVTISDLDRGLLNTHPWSLTGGVASSLQSAIGRAGSERFGNHVFRVGFFADSHADEAFFLTSNFVDRLEPPSSHAISAIRGEGVRDWATDSTEKAIFPYDTRRNLVAIEALGPLPGKYLWMLRTLLGGRSTYKGGSYVNEGRSWYEWHQLPKDKGAHPWVLAYAEVATHNHFILDRGRRIFNRTAPVIKLPGSATEDMHCEFLGLLNSSVICFWLKQMCFNKGRPGAEQAGADERWEHRYQFNGANIEEIPLSSECPLKLGRRLDVLSREYDAMDPVNCLRGQRPGVDMLSNLRVAALEIRARMIAVQEELDWHVYSLYQLADEDLTYHGDDLPDISPSERAFSIVLARDVVNGDSQTTWFTHHNHRHKLVTEMPSSWPMEYQDLVQRRIDAIASNDFIHLLERPEYKRRWAQEPWEKRQERALREWLLDRLEDRRFWVDPQGRPRPRSIAQLADDVARDADLTSVLELWEGRPDVPVTQSLTKLMTDEAVPFLAAYRYKDSGLRKRADWENTWALQRREDQGENVGKIDVPPKYAPADFRKPAYWHARGKLDVPKERFILYPDAGRETDPTPLLGWAGWDHAQQSLALATIITERQAEGWAADKLIPLVAGLEELQPWVEQWHGEIDPAFGVSMATFCREQLTTRAAQVGRTLAELRQWRPEARKIRNRSSPR